MSYVNLTCKQVVGRVEHPCVWCPEKIEPGEKHWYRAYKWEGDFVTDRMHVECYTAACEDDWNEGEGFVPHQFKRGTAEER